MSSGDAIPTAAKATIIHPINGNARPTSRNGDFIGPLSRKMTLFASTPLSETRDYALPAIRLKCKVEPALAGPVHAVSSSG